MSRIPEQSSEILIENTDIKQQYQFIEYLTKNYESVNEQYNILNELVPPLQENAESFGGSTLSTDISRDPDQYRKIISDNEKRKLKNEMIVIKEEIQLRNSKIKTLEMIQHFSDLIAQTSNNLPAAQYQNDAQKDYMRSISTKKKLWEAKLKIINVAIRDLRGKNPEMYKMGKSPFANPCIDCQYKIISEITGFPQIPVTEQNIDGAGLFNSEQPTDQDKSNWRFWFAGGGLSRLINLYGDAGRHMAHFLEASGEPLKISVEDIQDDIPEFNKAIDNKLDESVAILAGDFVDTGRDVPFETEWAQFPDEKFLSYEDLRKNYKNWFYATGIFSYKVKGTVTIIPPDKAGGKPRYDVKYQVFIYDRYNWDQGKAVTVLGITVTDIELARLHRSGLAQEYFIYGIGDEKSKSYK